MKEIKEFEDFDGQDGYLIVDGIDAQTPGGKKLLSTIGGGLTPITVNGVYTDNLYTVTIPSNNTFVTVPNITQEVNNLVVKIVPPAISSGEFLNVIVELVPKMGWDKYVSVDGGLHKLGRVDYFPALIEGNLYAQVILRGNCYEVLIEEDGE